MRNVLWIDNHPVICGGPQCAPSVLLDPYRMQPHLLAEIDRGEGSTWQAAVEAQATNPKISSASRLFWRTRLRGEWVPWMQLEKFLPHLAPAYAPLSRWIPETHAKVYCSSRRNTNEK